VVTYDAIGRTYRQTRRPDPRIAVAILDALGDAASVVNVGAGAGSYEPAQTLVAVEPSRVMIEQRPAGSAPVVQVIPLQTLTELVPGAEARIRAVPVPHDCIDGFGAAYWRRPEAYLDPRIRAGMSMLAKTDEAALRPGLERLADDVSSGRWHARHAALSELDSLDVEYRTVTIDV
jgi:hypothetical protein